NSPLHRLDDLGAAEAFVDSGDVAVVGFFENKDAHGYNEFLAAAAEVKSIPVAVCSNKEVWEKYNVTSDTISIFRKADLHQENLQLSKAKTVDIDGLKRFITMYSIRYITEYNQMTAVGLFKSGVKTHLLLFTNRGSGEYRKLKEQLATLAPEFTGKFLFVLIDGEEKSNDRSLDYFGLKPRDLPRVGIYDGHSDRKWLMSEGEISTDRVRSFCQSFLDRILQKVNDAGQPEARTEL
uniref:Endoplasmic reticulum resident protein 27 n=1 Tax=Denticeps clupeoides TaxID=299321 RepID=A0AAY4A0K9_9TELE